MKICIPVVADQGLNSQVNGHFGSAPYFAVCDTENNGIEIVQNDNAHHSHGMCHPLSVIRDKSIDVVVCNGMGMRAIQKLNEGGIKAYLADKDTVAEIIESYNSGKLQEITIENACQQHGCH